MNREDFNVGEVVKFNGVRMVILKIVHDTIFSQFFLIEENVLKEKNGEAQLIKRDQIHVHNIISGNVLRKVKTIPHNIPYEINLAFEVKEKPSGDWKICNKCGDVIHYNTFDKGYYCSNCDICITKTEK